MQLTLQHHPRFWSQVHSSKVTLTRSDKWQVCWARILDEERQVRAFLFFRLWLTFASQRDFGFFRRFQFTHPAWALAKTEKLGKLFDTSGSNTRAPCRSWQQAEEAQLWLSTRLQQSYTKLYLQWILVQSAPVQALDTKAIQQRQNPCTRLPDTKYRDRRQVLNSWQGTTTAPFSQQRQYNRGDAPQLMPNSLDLPTIAIATCCHNLQHVVRWLQVEALRFTGEITGDISTAKPCGCAQVNKMKQERHRQAAIPLKSALQWIRAPSFHFHVIQTPQPSGCTMLHLHISLLRELSIDRQVCLCHFTSLACVVWRNLLPHWKKWNSTDSTCSESKSHKCCHNRTSRKQPTLCVQQSAARGLPNVFPAWAKPGYMCAKYWGSTTVAQHHMK